MIQGNLVHDRVRSRYGGSLQRFVLSMQWENDVSLHWQGLVVGLREVFLDS